MPNGEYIASRKVTFAQGPSPRLQRSMLERPLSSTECGDAHERANTLAHGDSTIEQPDPYSPMHRLAAASPFRPALKRGPVAPIDYTETHTRFCTLSLAESEKKRRVATSPGWMREREREVAFASPKTQRLATATGVQEEAEERAIEPLAKFSSGSRESNFAQLGIKRLSMTGKVNRRSSCEAEHSAFESTHWALAKLKNLNTLLVGSRAESRA